jgi:hypothetical protein
MALNQKLIASAIAVTFLWLGFVLAISFMEAPVKFTAPSLTLSAGLDVGRRVFFVLNKIELAFGIILLLIFLSTKIYGSRILLLSAILIILLIQTIFLLPMLDIRAEEYISGSFPPPSNLHLFYIVSEIVKVVLLFLTGLLLFSKFRIFNAVNET